MFVKDSAVKKCKVIALLQIVGAAMMLFVFGICTFSCIGDAELASDGFWQFCVVCDVIGLLLLYFGVKRMRIVSEVTKYLNIAAGSPSIDFEKLSPLVQESVNTIKKNFEWMIRKHFFEDAYINYEAQAVIFKLAYMKEATRVQQAQERAQKIEYAKQVCECCGGTTKVIKGQDGVCEYCGAPIKWE